ncbi:hypothetical protein FRB96_007973 [Tulasnella sp. 330]|nr:hypothetical protein FRB96_007973 [Tulasnella sp. 330]KAG8889237.1 hypothetical protein FRB98_005249 [Tulasnella sp. 332]
MPPKVQRFLDSLKGTSRPPSYGHQLSAYNEYASDDTKTLIQEPPYGMPSAGSSKGTPIGYPPEYPPVPEYASDRAPQRPRPKQVLPTVLKTWYLILIIIWIFVLGFFIQYLLYLSQKHGGFVVPNLDDFGGLNYFKSAIPVVLAMPIIGVFTSIDGAIVALHPYVAFAEGGVSAERSLLLHYAGSRHQIMFKAWRNRHYVVLFSSVTCVIAMTLQPLASGILASRGVGVTVPNIPVQSQKSLGMIPDANTLETFLAAAGYASAAAIQPLGSSPFTLGEWAVAQFTIPSQQGVGFNGTVNVPTTAIETDAGCGTPDTFNASDSGTNLTFTATWSGCQAIITTPDSTIDQFGVQPVTLCQGNGTLLIQETQFQPVVFWFYSATLKQGNVVFCHPTSVAWNVIASVDLNSGNLVDVTPLDQNVSSNNFTGPPVNGQTYNGVQFDTSSDDATVQARAIAIQSALPGAIFRAARETPGGLAGMISTDSGQPLFDLTNRTYSQFLATAAQTTYFFDDQETINSNIVNWELRLWVYPVGAFSFQAHLIAIAVLAIFVHINHRKARKDVYISTDTALIAAAITMTSESSWTKVLSAGDDEAAVARKLKGKRFGISKRTWQIVAEDDEEGGGRGYVGAHEDRASLLSHAESSGKGIDPWERMIDRVVEARGGVRKGKGREGMVWGHAAKVRKRYKNTANEGDVAAVQVTANRTASERPGLEQKIIHSGQRHFPKRHNHTRNPIPKLSYSTSYASVPTSEHDAMPLLARSGSQVQEENMHRPRQIVSLFLKSWFIFLIVVGMILLAGVVETVLYLSQKNLGWQLYDFSDFGGINFLKSSIPVVLTFPITMLWMTVDQEMAKLHPFVVLSKGNAPGPQSVLLDYTSGRVHTLMKSFQYRHWVIFFSSVVCLANLSLSPLASSLLTTRNTMILETGVPLTSIKTLGLVPDYSSLEFFVAASGYASAAAIHNLTDPPFLFKGSWAIAEWDIPPPSKIGAISNQTVFLNTTGVESISNCQVADSEMVIDDDTSSGNITISGSWSGCNITFQVTDTESDQYGVLPLNNCNQFQQPPQYQPVIFYVYSFLNRVIKLTFCQPSLQLSNVEAGVDMHTGLVNSVIIGDSNVPESNVTGLPAFNGITFIPNPDPYINARSLSTQTAIPFAIYQGATVQPGGVSAVAQLDDGFLNITNTVYTRFLALAAKSVYFVGTDESVTGEIATYETRLWVNPLAAHAFSAALIFIAVLASITHIAHRRARQHVYLSCSTSTIAGVLSMTSHSQFPKLLHAGMDEDDLHNALKGMRFGISAKSWQVTARGEGGVA